MLQAVRFIIPAIVLIVSGFFALRWLVQRVSPQPDNLGVADGRLTPCPPTPNCVSTQSQDEQHRMEPLSYRGTTAAARNTILHIIRTMPHTTLITNNPHYIHAEFRTQLWRFVDDVEFYFDEETKQIHFRSASRLGQGDMGVNRKRMETIQAAFQQSSQQG